MAPDYRTFLRLALIIVLGSSSAAFAQNGVVAGTVLDETGASLPGVAVELRAGSDQVGAAVTDNSGAYRVEGVPAGSVEASFTLINFAPIRRTVNLAANGTATVDVVLHLRLSAEVTVTGSRTFANLADARDPAASLVGIARSASQGAVTAAQLEGRPISRAGEVLETIPGVVISQHSGEGKANQYYLRGFNLDHGTDFATTVASMPINMPTHGHGHGYTDVAFLIPELVSGVQFSKGPYFADQGDFAAAGSANISYLNVLERPVAAVSGGQGGFVRALAAASPRVGDGYLLAAFEAGHNDGPWVNPENNKKVNGIVRYTQGDTVNGLSVTGMAYKAEWDATDQIPLRAVQSGILDRFGTIDTTDGGNSYRYSGSLEWQRTAGGTSTAVSAYGIGYDLQLFSNFSYFLGDPDLGDQFEQADHRFVTGARISHSRLGRWQGRLMQNTFGGQLRNDRISDIGLHLTTARTRVSTVREDDVLQTSGGVWVQNEIEWGPWLRTLGGLRADVYRFSVDSDNPLNSGVESAGLVSPKAGIILGPFDGTEFYFNAGLGFHSNDARGATITVDPVTGDPADRVTPLARARGVEGGVRTVAVRGLQSSLTLWMLGIDSELIFIGDAGSTEAGRPSRRYGIEWANYYRAQPWLTLDADVTWSRGRFTDDDPVGDRIPGSVETVVAAGAAVDDIRGVFGSLRLRYFGPRALLEDDSIRSGETSLVNLAAGYKITGQVRLTLDVFNLFDSEHSDIDYFYESRLPGEPDEGVADIHFHPTLPRTARVNLSVAF
ncbi:MAG: TonB-dependent receptor [Vicinamibacterales bacterium]